MAETLLAIALVTSSSNGSSLICRWPPSPQATPRLARPRPNISYDPDQYDNPCRSANSKDGNLDDDGHPLHAPQRAHDEWEYIWQRPRAARDRSHSISRSTSHSAPSGRTSPIKEGGGGGGGSGAGPGGGSGGATGSGAGGGGGGMIYDVDVDGHAADAPLHSSSRACSSPNARSAIRNLPLPSTTSSSSVIPYAPMQTARGGSSE